jgi:proline iminopeptidase
MSAKPRDTRRRVAAAGIATGVALALERRLMTWGSTPSERLRPLPGDGLIPGERGVTTMATTIDAPPEAVWPWLAQMGWDRAGWYSWDRLDRGGKVSAEALHPEWQALREGDHLASMADDRSWFVVAHVESGRSLVLRAPLDLRGRPFDPAGPRPRRFVDSRWEFFLAPSPDGMTRLLVRSGSAARPRVMTRLADLLFWSPVHVVMQRRQFRNLRRRVERSATGRGPGGAPRLTVVPSS